MANDIENSLVGFFREAGLGLATTLLSRSQGSPSTTVPLSITRFLNEAASQYDDLLRRLAFSTVSVDIFAQPEDSDREYIGQISQGFFAIGAAIVDTYKQIGKDIINVEYEVKGLLKDLYDAYNSGSVPIPVPGEAAKLLEFKNELEKWMKKFASALQDVDSILHGDKCAQFTVIAKYADKVIDKIPSF